MCKLFFLQFKAVGKTTCSAVVLSEPVDREHFEIGQNYLKLLKNNGYGQIELIPRNNLESITEALIQ